MLFGDGYNMNTDEQEDASEKLARAIQIGTALRKMMCVRMSCVASDLNSSVLQRSRIATVLSFVNTWSC